MRNFKDLKTRKKVRLQEDTRRTRRGGDRIRQRGRGRRRISGGQETKHRVAGGQKENTGFVSRGHCLTNRLRQRGHKTAGRLSHATEGQEEDNRRTRVHSAFFLARENPKFANSFGNQSIHQTVRFFHGSGWHHLFGTRQP